MAVNIQDKIAEELTGMPAVNHHEHAWRSFSQQEIVVYDLPFYLCSGHVSWDMAAAGFREEPGMFDYLKTPRNSWRDGPEQAWKKILPFLAKVRNGAYFRHLATGLDELFSVSEEDIFSDRWREASEKIYESSLRHRGIGAAISRRLQIVATVLDAKFEPPELPKFETEGHLIVHVARMDPFIHEERGLAEVLEKYRPRDFEQWLATFEDVFQKSVENGARGFKCALAYNRRIEFSNPAKDEAARIFEGGVLKASSAQKTLYQDFMVNCLCRLCVKAGAPLQIHAGIQGGTGHLLEEARPTLLAGLLRRHGDLRVDLSHGGYPWYAEAGLMAKYFPNVHINGCWLSHISPSAYRAALTSWIETVPMSKIFAWGGDSTLLEHSWASLALAKNLAGEVLADFVKREYFDLELAIEVAHRIFHANGEEFWGLGASQR